VFHITSGLISCGLGGMQVNVISGVVSGINIRFVDTPGLEASASAVRKNQGVLLGIKAAHKKYNPDIVLYVDRVDMVRRSLSCPLLSKNTHNTSNVVMYDNSVGVGRHMTA
jgi:hypothetical protein